MIAAAAFAAREFSRPFPWAYPIFNKGTGDWGDFTLILA